MPKNWVVEIIEAILQAPRKKFIRTCVRLITPPRKRANKDEKCFFSLGGPADFYRISQKRFLEVDPPIDPIKPYNPFKDFFLIWNLPKTYRLTRRKREVIVYTIFLAKILRELYEEEIILLATLGIYVPNAVLTTEHFNFELLRKAILPFLISTTESLIRQNLLTQDLGDMYVTCLDLLSFFEDTIIDKRKVSHRVKQLAQPLRQLKELRELRAA